MAIHTITTQWGEIPEDADDLALVQGGFRTFGCECGTPLPDRVSAELHATETGQCTACLGSAGDEIVPGFVRRCTACAGTGRRKNQLIWDVAHGEAEQMITLELVRGLIARFTGPFKLSEAADATRLALDLPLGRLPVGPRVRDLLRELEAAGELILVSAPDELLRGVSVVLYRDPRWQRVVPPSPR